MVRPQGQDQRQLGRKRLNVCPSNKQWTEKFKSKSYSESKHVAFPSDESEERNPMPKPRWNPRPEQIRLLEGIFNSGMVNPPKEEISKIRAHLQEYGQVVDSNVYHWFRNRKSRSKQKNRHQNSATKSAISRQPLLAPTSSSSTSNMSSSNGVRRGGFLDISKKTSGGSENKNYNILNYQNNQYLNLQANQMQGPPPNYHLTQQTGEIATGAYGGRQTLDPRVNEVMVGGDGASGSSQLESLSRVSLNNYMIAGNSSTSIVIGPRRSAFEDEVQRTLTFMNTNPITTVQTINVPPRASSYQIPPTSQVQGIGGAGMMGPQLESFSRMSPNNTMAGNSSTSVVTRPRRSVFEDEIQRTLAFMNTNPITTAQTINVPPRASSYQIPPTSQVQGVGGAGMMGPPKSIAIVLINGVKVKVSPYLPFFVQEAFGEDAMLFYPSGHPVPTNSLGATLHPLKHGASYFLKCRVHAYESLIDEEEARRQLNARGCGFI